VTELLLCAEEAALHFHCSVKLFYSSDLPVALTLKTKHSAAQWLLCVPPAHRVSCILYGSQNKQQLFPPTALTVWSL